MTPYGERPGGDYPSSWWSSVRALYDEAFPGLPAGIDRASAVGVRWADVTTPFALFEGDRCVCHVGVLTHPMRLEGRAVSVAGIHAVCTAEDRRRRGLCRQTLSRALAWADRAHDVAKLHTDDPPVYRSHGFRTAPTWRYRSNAQAAAGVDKRLIRPSVVPEDAELLAKLLADRAPVSNRCASTDPGWMITIVAALSGRLDTAMWWLPEHQAVVVFGEDQGQMLVVEVIGRRLPPAEVILGAAPEPHRPALWTFAPDLVEPAATPVRVSAHTGAFMVRGAWPDSLAPFGLSPLWEH